MLDALSGEEIAHWFIDSFAANFNQQDEDGIMHRKDEDGYDYVHVLAMVDLDICCYFLLDVRTHHQGYADPSTHETRDFLYVGSGARYGLEFDWHNKPVKYNAPDYDHLDHLDDGLKWFFNKVMLGQQDESLAAPEAVSH